MIVKPRRAFMVRWLAALAALGSRMGGASAAATDEPFIARAFEMKRQAVASGDQPYGAVVVRDGTMVGEAPSRVIAKGDFNAHAEREAIADAQRRLGTKSLAGCVLYSSSRPCRQCETAAWAAGIARMIHGESATDAGAPTPPR